MKGTFKMTDLTIRLETEKDYREEFMKFYHSVEDYLEDLIARSTNLDVLNRVRNIISYRTKILEKNL